MCIPSGSREKEKKKHKRSICTKYFILYKLNIQNMVLYNVFVWKYIYMKLLPPANLQRRNNVDSAKSKQCCCNVEQSLGRLLNNIKQQSQGGTWRLYNVALTLIQRHDVNVTLYKSHAPRG